VHFVPQTYFIYNDNDHCMVDKVLHLERLSDEFDEVKNSIGVTGDLPFSNRKKIKGECDQALTEVSISKIKKIYSRDYLLLGY
jgi:hypothetical protein